MTIKHITLVALLLLMIVLQTKCFQFKINNILSSSFKKTIIRTLQIDNDWKKESNKNELHDKYEYSNMQINSRQKRLFETYKQNLKKNYFGWSKDNEIINGRLAMLGFFAMFIVEEITDESILEQIGIIEHGTHLSLYILLSTLIIQPIVEFFEEK